MVPQLRSTHCCGLFLALLAALCASGRAETPASSSPPNPRFAGTPFLRTWLADDYGAHPENTCIVQHPATGLIYVGNRYGVLEYDGVRWRLIPKPGGDIVSGLRIDSRGRIWGCANTTIFRLEPDAHGELHARSMLDRLPPAARSVTMVRQSLVTPRGIFFHDHTRLFLFPIDDGPPHVWRATDGKYVLLNMWKIGDEPYMTAGGNQVFRLRGDHLERITGIDHAMYDLRPAADGTWEGASSSGFDRWNGTQQTVLRRLPAGIAARQGILLADGRAVFATADHGIVVCDRNGRFQQQIDRRMGLPGNLVTGVMEDREGGVWAALPIGVARVQLDSPYVRYGPAQGLEGTVHSLAQLGGTLYAGGTEGVAQRGTDGRFHALNGGFGSVRELRSQDGWLYAMSAQLNGVQPALGNQMRELENRNYYGLVPLSGAPGWFAHGSNVGLRWAHFAGASWVSEGSLQAIHGAATALLESPAGIVWATGDSHLWRIDFRTGLGIDAPARRFTAAEGMPEAPAALFLLGEEVVAVAGGHLLRYDAGAQHFTPETRVDGVDHFPIEATHVSADGSVWLQAAPPFREIRRLVRDASPATVPLAAHWHAELLPGDPLRHLMPTTLFHDVGAETLWIAGHGSLIARDLRWRPTHPVIAPVADIRRIETADGQLIYAGSFAAALPPLPPDQNAVRISFAAARFSADYAGVMHLDYRTQLVGLDDDWTAWSRQTERDFTNLPWRNFIFRVQARDDAGRLGPVATLRFSIQPAWWATPWAWLGYGVLAVFVVGALVRLRTETLSKRAARLQGIVAERTRELADSNTQLSETNARLAATNTELARLHRLELDEKIAARLAEEKARLEVLRYQLNPHFLYNSLNSIYGLLFEDGRAAAEMVLRLSDFCRATLTGTEELRPVGAELDALRTYLDVEKVRWGEKLQLDFDVAPEVAAMRLPPFLLLPLVENAIKYGSRTSPNVLRLRIRAQTDAGALLLEVANTGTWLPPDPSRPGSTGIGLENLHQRLRRYYPDAHEFTTTARDGWVVVQLRLVVPELQRGAIAPAQPVSVHSPR